MLRNSDGIATGVPTTVSSDLQLIGEPEQQRRRDRAARTPPAEDHRGEGDEALARGDVAVERPDPPMVRVAPPSPAIRPPMTTLR